MNIEDVVEAMLRGDQDIMFMVGEGDKELAGLLELMLKVKRGTDLDERIEIGLLVGAGALFYPDQLVIAQDRERLLEHFGAIRVAIGQVEETIAMLQSHVDVRVKATGPEAQADIIESIAKMHRRLARQLDQLTYAENRLKER